MKFFYLILSSIFLTIPEATANPQVNGKNHLETGYNAKDSSNYLESWLNTRITGEYWEAKLGFEAHLPAASFSADTAGFGLYQRSFAYHYKNNKIEAGTQYATAASGVGIRLFQDRTIRWDSNLDGLLYAYEDDLFQGQILAGKVRELNGTRKQWLKGAEFNYLTSWLSTGTSAFFLQNQDSIQTYWNTLSLGLRQDWGEFSLIAGARDQKKKDFDAFTWNKLPGEYLPGAALYSTISLYLGDLSFLSEFKDYRNFEIKDGAVYNNPPAAIKEHFFTLMARHALVLNANDEQGYMLEATYPFLDEFLLQSSFSQTKNHNDDLLYQDLYNQFEIQWPEDWQSLIGFGLQEDAESKYLNLGYNQSIPLSDNYALKPLYEHQHTTMLINDRMFYSQIYGLAFSNANGWTLSLSTERTTDQLSTKKYWFGSQLDYSLSDSHNFTFFAGSRKKGKVCSGGICVYKPELNGIELTIHSKF